MSVAPDMPAVSVIIPAHNAAAFIADAVDGVRAQTVHDYEIIIVDDGSTDQTTEVLSRWHDVRRSHQRNRGAAAARNAGLDMAAGEFICFLDADDVWLPDKLALQLEFMAAHPEVGLLFADASEWRDDVVEKPSILATMTFGVDAQTQVPISEAFRKLLIENFIPTSTVMVRRSCIAQSGPFNVELPNAEDRDMWLRVAARTAIACVPRVLARKRSHGANISMRTEIALRSRIRVWLQCREQFPALAPHVLYDRLLAGSYQQLGYLLLEKREHRVARRCASASLVCAARWVITNRSGFPYRWRLSFALMALSFVPSKLVRTVWQARNALRRRHTTPASAA